MHQPGWKSWFKFSILKNFKYFWQKVPISTSSIRQFRCSFPLWMGEWKMINLLSSLNCPSDSPKINWRPIEPSPMTWNFWKFGFIRESRFTTTLNPGLFFPKSKIWKKLIERVRNRVMTIFLGNFSLWRPSAMRSTSNTWTSPWKLKIKKTPSSRSTRNNANKMELKLIMTRWQTWSHWWISFNILLPLNPMREGRIFWKKWTTSKTCFSTWLGSCRNRKKMMVREAYRWRKYYHWFLVTSLLFLDQLRPPTSRPTTFWNTKASMSQFWTAASLKSASVSVNFKCWARYGRLAHMNRWKV